MVESQTPEIELVLGAPKSELATPALLLDLDKFESNLQKMASYTATHSMGLRPHAKSHKCAEIAKRQISAGALGICAATITEAEKLSAKGVTGILITSEMVGNDRIDRLARLTQRAPDTISVVDNPIHVQELAKAARRHDVVLNLMVDLDLGLRRTGVASVAEGMALAESVMKSRGLRLLGVNAYSSMSAHVTGWSERRTHSLNSMKKAVDLFLRMKNSGMPIEILSGSSTGTYNIDIEIPEMTELQAGSYVFMDVDYSIIGGERGPVYDDFQKALTVLATVVSKSHKGVATIDAGFKAFATDRPFGPDIKEGPAVKYHFGGDEHGILEILSPEGDSESAFVLGSKLEFVVPHCDPTVNLYDRILCTRDDKVEAVWTIERGYC